MTSPKRKTPAQQRADALLLATDVLSSRVGALADAVQINNHKIDILQREVNTKPDDTEVKFITGMASVERNRHLRWALCTAILAAVGAGLVAFQVADMQGEARCEINAQNIRTIVNLLESVPDPQGKFDATINDLNSNRNECE